jgi:hypothetical protein
MSPSNENANPEEEGQNAAEKAQEPERAIEKANPRPDPDMLFPTPEMLEGLPVEARRFIETNISMMRMGPLPSPVAEKVTPEHIDKLIDNSENDAKREHDTTRRTQWMTFATVFGVLALLVVVVLAPNPTQFAQDMMKLFLGFVTGGLAGYGIGKRGA